MLTAAQEIPELSSSKLAAWLTDRGGFSLSESKVMSIARVIRPARAFRDYLHTPGIRHIFASPFHRQPNGKLERYHQTLKKDVNQLPYEMPSELEAAIGAFVSHYNYRRYHKALGNDTPSDVLRGGRDAVLRRRKEIQAETIQRHP